MQNDAYGILAQSIGGDGGNGGFSGVVALGGAVGVGVGVGGSGGGGGNAGAVQVTSAGDIATVFNNSDGILAQSIGGGGGNGGFSIAVSGSGSSTISAARRRCPSAATAACGRRVGRGCDQHRNRL